MLKNYCECQGGSFLPPTLRDIKAPKYLPCGNKTACNRVRKQKKDLKRACGSDSGKLDVRMEQLSKDCCYTLQAISVTALGWEEVEANWEEAHTQIQRQSKTATTHNIFLFFNLTSLCTCRSCIIHSFTGGITSWAQQ